MNGTWISGMLMAFGVIMIAGNFLFGGSLQRNMVKTVAAFPILYLAVYLLVYMFGASFAPMLPIVLLWGVIHSGGLIVSQTWLMTEVKDAPEFGNSLFVSFSNLGITLGSSLGGWFISQFGIHQLIWSGMIFAALAFVLILVKLKIFSSRAEQAPAA
jgi:predicted MFS family arabinose efflux permease